MKDHCVFDSSESATSIYIKFLSTITFSIRLEADDVWIPSTICVSKYGEHNNKGKSLRPEQSSKHAVFQSI